VNRHRLRDKRGEMDVVRWPTSLVVFTISYLMGTETERKFLVTNDAWRAASVDNRRLRQGYVAIDGPNTVRIRTDGERAWLTLKGPQRGITRPEFEYEIPPADAESLICLCRGRIVEKVRYRVPFGRHVWEIDEFFGANAGLVVAEVELSRPDEPLERPEWLGDEVSEDSRYLNASLSLKPFGEWSQK
jgi:adenylate cyclase